MKNNIEISFNYEPKVEIKGDVSKEYLVEFINSQTNIVEHSSKIKNNMWTKCNKRYHIPWTIRVNGEIVHKWNLKDKNILISLDSKSIGDTLAWAPQAVEFAKNINVKLLYLLSIMNGLKIYQNIKTLNLLILEVLVIIMFVIKLVGI